MAERRPSLIAEYTRRGRKSREGSVKRRLSEMDGAKTARLLAAPFVHPGINPAHATNLRARALNVRKGLCMRGQVNPPGCLVRGNPLCLELCRLREQIGQIGLEFADQILVGKGSA